MTTGIVPVSASNLSSGCQPQIACYHGWMRDYFLICCRLHLEPNNQLHHHHHLPSVSHQKGAGSTCHLCWKISPFCGTLISSDLLPPCGSERLGDTRLVLPFVITSASPHCFLLPSLSPPSETKSRFAGVCARPCGCGCPCTHTLEWTRIIPVDHLWAPAIFLTSRQTTLDGRKAFFLPSIYTLYILSIHCNVTDHLL